MARSSAQGKKLVIVESPTKARTIKKFLDGSFIVESCMGHVRDLPKSAKEIPEKYKKQSWSRLGVNTDSNFEPIYLVPKTKTKIVTQLKKLMKEADELILATDEDREGESISWHLLEVLKPNIPTKRMVFHEITKKAIKESLENFREVNFDMVRAQEARRVLDRLVGFTISPLLWKKVAYGLSAGRVQSVAVRLIAEKEHERIKFVKSFYQSISAKTEKDSKGFDAKLIEWDGQRIATGKDFDETSGKLLASKSDYLHLEGGKTEEILTELGEKDLKVESVEAKPVSRKPAPPFITSTLQQEANRKLGMSSREAMQVAQKLYEQGYITYMRTDSTFLSSQAMDAARSCILDLYGKDYLPEAPRNYAKKKVKGAQEAHEAIRPAGTEFVKPDDTKLKGAQLSLYELIWKRTVASQMVNAQQRQVSIRLSADKGTFSASGLTLVFPGFFKAYVEGSDDPNQALANREVHLPDLKVGDQTKVLEIGKNDHETKPPARYTEASLVQKLEKEGIGRPSTYASIIGTVQDRGYVKKVGNSLQPTFTALIVTRLLERHLPNYVDLNFTSSMEQCLDEIAQGERKWTDYLHTVYSGDEGLKAHVEMKESEIDDETSRTISLKGLNELVFKVGRYGAYVCRMHEGEEVCASLPEDHAPADVDVNFVEKLIDQKINGTDALGQDPETGLPIYVLNGRYGPYLQLGESAAEKEKPKRVSIPPTIEPDNISFDQALFLLSLPKTLGTHPESGLEIKAGLGRFGPFVVYEGDFRSIPKDMSLFTINLEQALELLARPKRGRGRAAPLKVLGNHPELEIEIAVYNGKYGPYVKCDKVNVSLPDDMEPEKVDLKFALELLAPKIEEKKLKKKKTKKKASSSKKKTKTKKKTASKASSSKKTATKKKVIRRAKAS